MEKSNQKTLGVISNHQAIQAILNNTENNRSDKYKHIQTSQVVNYFTDKGWTINAVSTKNHDTEVQQYHIVRMRHADFKVENDHVELLIGNSYNGSKQLELSLGVFRTVCANGLISGENFYSCKIKHIGGFINQQLETEYFKITALAPKIKYLVNDMKNKVLDEKGKVKLIRRALKARGIDDSKLATVHSLTARLGKYKATKTIDKIKNKTIDYNEILKPLRDADNGNDLWTIFNVVQEKMIRGGVKHLRPITELSRNKQLNQDLFNIATKMVA